MLRCERKTSPNVVKEISESQQCLVCQFHFRLGESVAKCGVSPQSARSGTQRYCRFSTNQRAPGGVIIFVRHSFFTFSPIPWTSRPESRASKQIRRCQLVAVVVMSVVTAAVIILFWSGKCNGA